MLLKACHGARSIIEFHVGQLLVYQVKTREGIVGIDLKCLLKVGFGPATVAAEQLGFAAIAEGRGIVGGQATRFSAASRYSG